MIRLTSISFMVDSTPLLILMLFDRHWCVCKEFPNGTRGPWPDLEKLQNWICPYVILETYMQARSAKLRSKAAKQKLRSKSWVCFASQLVSVDFRWPFKTQATTQVCPKGRKSGITGAPASFKSRPPQWICSWLPDWLCACTFLPCHSFELGPIDNKETRNSSALR